MKRERLVTWKCWLISFHKKSWWIYVSGVSGSFAENICAMFTLELIRDKFVAINVTIFTCTSSIVQIFCLQSPHFDGKIPNWYHFKCFWMVCRASAINEFGMCVESFKSPYLCLFNCRVNILANRELPGQWVMIDVHKLNKAVFLNNIWNESVWTEVNTALLIQILPIFIKEYGEHIYFAFLITCAWLFIFQSVPHLL